MNTPICDFVKQYCEKNPTRLHMPGHKGSSLLGFEHLDITEFDGADVLYHETGIIAESQQNATRLFGTAKTLYSTEGSSLVIRAMLYLVAQYAKTKGQEPRIAAGRNVHKSFVNAAALLDIPVDWIYPETAGQVVSCDISAQGLDRFLDTILQKPTAVYITSPDYLGNIADVQGLSQVCKKHGVLLVVDNAHGAYLQFLTPSRHPMALGADLCCDSAHKTLPALTGAGYLHIAKTAPDFLREQAANALSLFASTSPSYLILQSLDKVNEYLAKGYALSLEDFTQKVFALKERLRKHGYALVGDEPLKITIAPKSYGYTGIQLAEVLQEEGMVCEFYDPDFLVMMVTPESSEETLWKIEKVLCSLEKKESILTTPPVISPLKQGCSLHDALFAVGKVLPTNQCLGKILAQTTVSCPPAIPIVVCGEVLNEQAIALLAYYGIQECIVIE
jgi:arginine/lysine/ornithine decarboxylase